ncbi:MAG: GNAT family N-acetyltransferase, partial [Pseudomonadales bacterium]
MRTTFIDSIESVSCDQWNAVSGTDYPFTRYEFLHALEISGATNQQSGWQPQHILVYTSEQNDEELIAVMPLYLKYHSYGEYVFDWSWADAYRRHGVSYYPKLLSSIPFTPATGPRLCIKAGSNNATITAAVIAAIYQRAEALSASSIHILFPEKQDCCQFQQLGLSLRRGVQYHWFNQNFCGFDDFLTTFSSRKRKNLKKERRRIQEQNLRLEIIEGPDITPETWQRFYDFYQLTYAKRSGHGGYLKQQFFELLADTMAEHIVLVLAYNGDQNGKAIAGALNFRDSKTLYGRYWGCIQEHEFLHFEACYYQGIEYCINK